MPPGLDFSPKLTLDFSKKEVATNAPLFLGLFIQNVPGAKVLHRAQSQNLQPTHPEIFGILGSWETDELASEKG